MNGTRALSSDIASRRLRAGGAVAAATVLLALLAVLHAKAQDSSARRYRDVLAQLASLKLIDARWDLAVLSSRVDPYAATAPAAESGDAIRIRHALDTAAAEARSNALRATVQELRQAYAAKGARVTRYQQASIDSRRALDAAMRADAAVTRLVRSAWRAFPEHDRLVAAESTVSRVLAHAQQYHHSPSAAHRAALQAHAADLSRARALPRAVEESLARLASDVHQLLLLKPLEQTLGERLSEFHTGPRTDVLMDNFQRELTDTLARRDRYRIALIVYSAALFLLACYGLVRAYRYLAYSRSEAQSFGIRNSR